MWDIEQDWVLLLRVVQGQMEALILRSRLESEGIPVWLQYESVGFLYGITANELGEVRVMVPRDFLDPAQRALFPDDWRDFGEAVA